jgi:Terminase large subunit, T4likevirus-type, N-terminal
MNDLVEVTDDGRIRLHQHPGQLRAWEATARIIAVLAGSQGGKTSFGPWWLAREVQRRGGGDYIAATSTYDLFKLKMLPALRDCFEERLRIARYWSGDRILELCDPATGQYLARRADDRMWGRIILRSAESGGGLESATARAAWLDEAGQDAFDLDIYDAVRRRLSLSRGRLLLTTTLYNFGWLKTQIYDRARSDPDIQVIQFDSIENPQFPKAEYDERQRTMPRWRFNMAYRGLYERPAGLIYDSFLPDLHTRPRFPIDPEWQRYCGLDFGGVHTAAVFFAEDPASKQLYLYREYLEGGKASKEHATDLLDGEPMVPFTVGGSKSEGQWRREFGMGGLAVKSPDISDVEVGIDRVYGAFRRNEIIIFEDCTGTIDELHSYSRKLDANGEPTEEIADKAKYHRLDALRYIVGRIRRGA